MSLFAQRASEAADLVTVALDELLPRADGLCEELLDREWKHD